MKQRRGPEKDLIHTYSTTYEHLNKGCRLWKPVCALCPWVSFLVALPLSAWQLLYWLIYLGVNVCGSVFPLPLPARIVKTEGSQARSETAEPPVNELTAASLPCETHGVWWWQNWRTAETQLAGWMRVSWIGRQHRPHPDLLRAACKSTCRLAKQDCFAPPLPCLLPPSPSANQHERKRESNSLQVTVPAWILFVSEPRWEIDCAAASLWNLSIGIAMFASIWYAKKLGRRFVHNARKAKSEKVGKEWWWWEGDYL